MAFSPAAGWAGAGIGAAGLASMAISPGNMRKMRSRPTTSAYAGLHTGLTGTALSIGAGLAIGAATGSPAAGKAIMGGGITASVVAGISAARSNNINNVLWAANQSREEKGLAPIPSPFSFGKQLAAVGVARGLEGGISGAVIGGTAGAWVGGVTSILGGISQHVGKTAKALGAYIQSSATESYIQDNQIRGSHNATRQDPHSTEGLTQALHKTRHKRVL